jgi:hypothetical protein
MGGHSALDVTQLESGTATVVAGCVNSENSTNLDIVDGQGDLWAIQYVTGDEGDERLTMWTAAQQSQSCPSSPTYSVSQLLYAAALAFDPQGNAWVLSNGEVDMYSAANLQQRARYVSPDERLVLGGCSSVDCSLTPTAMAFDANGYLWISGWGSIVAYSPATLADAGQSSELGVADVFLSTAAALDGGTGWLPNDFYTRVAFDSAGDLWAIDVVEWGGGEAPGPAQLVEFSATQIRSLAQDPTPTPVQKWSELNGPILEQSSWMAFDAAGNLWIEGVTSEYNGTPVLLRFAPESAANGPDLVVDYEGVGGALAFDPIPPGLPIWP